MLGNSEPEKELSIMRGLSYVTVSVTLKIKVFLNGKLYDKTRHVVESTNLVPRTTRVH